MAPKWFRNRSELARNRSESRFGGSEAPQEAPRGPSRPLGSAPGGPRAAKMDANGSQDLSKTFQNGRCNVQRVTTRTFLVNSRPDGKIRGICTPASCGAARCTARRPGPLPAVGAGRGAISTRGPFRGGGLVPLGAETHTGCPSRQPVQRVMYESHFWRFRVKFLVQTCE